MTSWLSISGHCNIVCQGLFQFIGTLGALYVAIVISFWALFLAYLIALGIIDDTRKEIREMIRWWRYRWRSVRGPWGWRWL
jgi:hypothetical protein